MHSRADSGLKAAFFTLGCKLNQCETEAISGAFSSAGFSVCSFSEKALVYVVNSCTVTSKSEQKARRVIRKISREVPDSLLIVTGCYAQMEPGGLRELGPNVLVISLDNKDLILDLAAWMGTLTEGELREGGNLLSKVRYWLACREGGHADPSRRFRFAAADFNFHARAFLKIQDGCNHRCAYCRVCLARGASVSLEGREVLARLKQLDDQGYREVVLTGVNIDSWRDKTMTLSDLLSKILDRQGRFRIRLSSLEPGTLLCRDLSVLSHPRICPHFHISAQSGSSGVLRRMNRPYDASALTEAVQSLRALKDDPFLAADVIAGFPGESDRDHETSLALFQKLGLAKIHVFPFSPRPGTAAWTMGPAVPERIRDQRTRELRALSARGARVYREAQRGRRLSLLLEEFRGGAGGGFWVGTSENYQKIRLPGHSRLAKGNLVPCRVKTVAEGSLEAVFLAE